KLSRMKPKPIRTIKELGWHLGIPAIQLLLLAENIKLHYRVWSKVDPKKNKSRTFKVPDEKLKDVQRRILRRVLEPIALSDAAHGSVRGRSPRSNAQVHLGQDYLVNIDVRD